MNTGIKKGSPDRFGYEWSVYNKILPIYEEQFKRWTTLIFEQEWKDMTLLDVGCGTGRNSLWPIKYGAKKVVAIDVDEGSLNSARENLKDFSNAEVKKMSAYDIEYTDHFDISFSILPTKFTHFLSLFPTAAIYLLVRMGLGKIEYFRLIRKFSFWHLRSIVFDQMLSLMKKTGLKKIEIAQVNDMSWCAVGIK